jgi:hypothetical protein
MTAASDCQLPRALAAKAAVSKDVLGVFDVVAGAVMRISFAAVRTVHFRGWC